MAQVAHVGTAVVGVGGVFGEGVVRPGGGALSQLEVEIRRTVVSALVVGLAVPTVSWEPTGTLRVTEMQIRRRDTAPTIIPTLQILTMRTVLLTPRTHLAASRRNVLSSIGVVPVIVGVFRTVVVTRIDVGSRSASGELHPAVGIAVIVATGCAGCLGGPGSATLAVVVAGEVAVGGH